MKPGTTLAAIVLVPAVLVSGCAHPGTRKAPRDVPTPIPATATSRPTAMTPAELTDLLTGDGREFQRFYMGDHLTANRELTLMVGGGYALQWSGCEGLYGSAVGGWRLEDGRVVLEPIDERGICAERPLRALVVRLLPEGEWVNLLWRDVALVPEDGEAAFEVEGVRDDTCFRPWELVAEAWRRGSDDWP
jgi:hypothetical protein